VIFKVQDEVFHAHKIVLAMRSPVFKAELLGPMSDKSGKEIALHIEDMQPAIFKALLYFIYNDSLPGMEVLATQWYSSLQSIRLHGLEKKYKI
jgi:speckle-type POZ protein